MVAERMLRGLTTDTHCIKVVVEPILNFLQNGLVFPARDAALGACRAPRPQCASFAGACPISPDRLAMLLALKVVGQPLAGQR